VRASVTTTEARFGVIQKCFGGARRSTNQILHRVGSTDARNVHADFSFGDAHLGVQLTNGTPTLVTLGPSRMSGCVQSQLSCRFDS
jgi:hypothetical protein